MRYYSPTVRKRIKTGPSTVGKQLARLALQREFSVIEIAKCTGASRQTVYNWAAGRGVTNAYLPRVNILIKILKTARDYDAAWSAACQAFNLVL